MDIHEVQVKEPPLVAMDLEELCGCLEQIVVGSTVEDGGVLSSHAGRCRPADRAFVDLEALTETEVRGDPAVSPDARRPKAGLP